MKDRIVDVRFRHRRGHFTQFRLLNLNGDLRFLFKLINDGVKDKCVGLGRFLTYCLANILRFCERNVSAIIYLSDDLIMDGDNVKGAMAREVKGLLTGNIRMAMARMGILFMVNVIRILRIILLPTFIRRINTRARICQRIIKEDNVFGLRQRDRYRLTQEEDLTARRIDRAISSLLTYLPYAGGNVKDEFPEDDFGRAASVRRCRCLLSNDIRDVKRDFRRILFLFNRIRINCRAIGRLAKNASRHRRYRVNLNDLLTSSLYKGDRLDQANVKRRPLFLVFKRAFFLNFRMDFVTVLRHFVRRVTNVLRTIR